MNELNVNERDLLTRIREKPALRRVFFKKAKGLKWFNALDQAGYFNAEHLPAPVASKEEGYINIPRWEVLEYLAKTAPDLTQENDEHYARRFIEIIKSATNRAKDEGFSNYHAWWRLADILSNVPYRFLDAEIIDVVDYWLEDPFEKGLVVESLAERLLSDLLERHDEQSSNLAEGLLSTLFRVKFTEKNRLGTKRREAHLRVDSYRALQLTAVLAHKAGVRLGQRGVAVFYSSLVNVLDELQNDRWSSIWQPAIADHDQNKYHDDAENVLVIGCRDSLTGFVASAPSAAEEYLALLLADKHQTVQRIAIHCISQSPVDYTRLWDRLMVDQFLQRNFRHEIWHFLNAHYRSFDKDQKKKVLRLIQEKVRRDNNGAELQEASAYERSCWLAAIKEFGCEEAALYRDAVSVAKTEPEHPDLTSYISSGWVTPESPYSADELAAMEIGDLIHLLKTFKGGDGWREPGIEGLSKALKQAITANPLAYYAKLDHFTELDLAYVHSIIDAYNELWREKARLPWDDLWSYILAYIAQVSGQDSFWEPSNDIRREHFVANRAWVVGAVARLLEASTQSDDHAINEKYHKIVEGILENLLARQAGETFTHDCDAVLMAINSPRGRCIEALINLALRTCRLEDNRSGGHEAAWFHFQTYFDAELARRHKGEYEFAALITNYLPNFLYMSRQWVFENLGTIFDKDDYLGWLCAMQGYSYVNKVYEEIYDHLKDDGHIIRALDEDNLKDRVEDKIVQNVVVAYLNEYESISGPDSIMAKLIRRGDFDELGHLIWFVWTLRKKDDNKLKRKVFEIWPMILDVLDLSSSQGQKLASSLCYWATFVDHVDDKRKNLLLAVAPYADVSHNSYGFLKSLAVISERQPFEANEIWQAMLKAAAVEHPENAIRKILVNLVSQGEKGKRAARETVSAYIEEHGADRPSEWLSEIIRSER